MKTGFARLLRLGESRGRLARPAEPGTASSARWRPGLEILRIGALLLILALGLSLSGVLQRIDHLVFDLGQRLQPVVPPQGVVIVAIDSHSLDRLGAWPWPRATDARLVDAVCRAGAAAVGLDIAFTEAGSDAAGNAALAQSLRACGKVALPVVLDSLRSGGQIVEGLPIPQLAAAAAGLGRIGVQLDGDGVARSVYLWEGVGAPVWPLMAQTLLTIAHQPVRGSAPPPAHSAVPPHPYALAASAVLDGVVPPGALRGKVVLIGATAAGLGDFLATPVTTQGAPMPGVEVLANTLIALRDGTLIRTVSLVWSLLITALLALAPLLWLPRLMPLGGLIASVAWGLVLVGSAAALPLLTGWWVAPGGALVAALSAYPLWGWRRLEAARRHLDGELRQLRRTVRESPEGDAPAKHKRLSFERRILEVQAAQQRLRDLQTRRDDALAFISHDVRAPLAGAVQLLQSGKMDVAARDRLLTQLRRALNLSQGFLDLSRAQSLETSALVEIELGAVLHQAADFAYDEALAQGVRFVREIPDDPIWVRGDFDALERLTTNLLRNAVQHSPAGSKVILGATLAPHTVRFWVRDQGPGLTPEQSARLFQRFSRAHEGPGTPLSGSTGLGLYYVRLVAEKHGGAAGVTSHPGEGAMFWVELTRQA
ncbi:MAG: histidine kinase [Thiomonas sp. SCN 64-16]|uniref:CHASE2 domain-containing protein n=1 Tax=Thiomonas sp. SCN 64-16 TaxID=1660151 RepID=UPI00086AD24D|nr:CHASE2 domain-containing protein [Thiomonas sp. SCN 64-16]ODU95606.1 MAG: histidine kinase [Thiomonas sp. SCN 64-16]